MTRPKHSRRRRRRPPSGEDHFEGQTAEELAQALGLDELTTDACIQGLFGELFEDLGINAQGEAGSGVEADEEPIRVVQMGPGRRNSPEENERC